MNISFDKMKAFTMHSLRFYLLDWASSSVWDSYMWSGDSADSWQLCTSAHCSLLAEVKLKGRMIKRCGGLVVVPRCWCKGKVWLRMCSKSCLESLRFALTSGESQLGPGWDFPLQLFLTLQNGLRIFVQSQQSHSWSPRDTTCILSCLIWPQDVMWSVSAFIVFPCVWWKCIGQTLPAAYRLSHSIACRRRYMQIEGVEGLGGRWLCWKQSRHVPLLLPLAPFKSVCKLHKCTFKTLVSGVRTFFRQVTKEF